MKVFKTSCLSLVVLLAAISAQAIEPLKESGYTKTTKDGKPVKYVTSSGKQLREVVYKQVGEQKLRLDFYFPDEDTSANKPVVIYTHGGGWAAGSKQGAGNASFNVVHKALLKEGFCVAAVQYRLAKKDSGVAMRVIASLIRKMPSAFFPPIARRLVSTPIVSIPSEIQQAGISRKCSCSLHLIV